MGSSIFAPDVTRPCEVKVLLKCAPFFCGAFMRKTPAVAMSNGERDIVVGSARRRRERRLRCFLRHEEMAVRMALVIIVRKLTHAATLALSPVIEYVVPAPSATRAAPDLVSVIVTVIIIWK